MENKLRLEAPVTGIDMSFCGRYVRRHSSSTGATPPRSPTFLIHKPPSNPGDLSSNRSFICISDSFSSQGRKWRVGRVDNCPPSFRQNRRRRWAAAARRITTSPPSFRQSLTPLLISAHSFHLIYCNFSPFQSNNLH